MKKYILISIVLCLLKLFSNHAYALGNLNNVSGVPECETCCGCPESNQQNQVQICATNGKLYKSLCDYMCAKNYFANSGISISIAQDTDCYNKYSSITQEDEEEPTMGKNSLPVYYDYSTTCNCDENQLPIYDSSGNNYENYGKFNYMKYCYSNISPNCHPNYQYQPNNNPQTQRHILNTIAPRLWLPPVYNIIQFHITPPIIGMTKIPMPNEEKNIYPWNEKSSEESAQYDDEDEDFNFQDSYYPIKHTSISSIQDKTKTPRIPINNNQILKHTPERVINDKIVCDDENTDAPCTSTEDQTEIATATTENTPTLFGNARKWGQWDSLDLSSDMEGPESIPTDSRSMGPRPYIGAEVNHYHEDPLQLLKKPFCNGTHTILFNEDGSIKKIVKIKMKKGKSKLFNSLLPSNRKTNDLEWMPMKTYDYNRKKHHKEPGFLDSNDKKRFYRKDTEKNFDESYCGNKCSKEISQQICASNGEVYNNPCIFNCVKNILKQQGEIITGEICSSKHKDFVPECPHCCPCSNRVTHIICASNGETYISKCYYRCAKKYYLMTSGKKIKKIPCSGDVKSFYKNKQATIDKHNEAMSPDHLEETNLKKKITSGKKKKFSKMNKPSFLDKELSRLDNQNKEIVSNQIKNHLKKSSKEKIALKIGNIKHRKEKKKSSTFPQVQNGNIDLPPNNSVSPILTEFDNPKCPTCCDLCKLTTKDANLICANNGEVYENKCWFQCAKNYYSKKAKSLSKVDC